MPIARRILLADDESYVTTVLATKLRAAGHEVLVASHGEEAFDLAVTHRPDIIISDYQMPVLSGFEMSVRLKQDPRTAHLPVLMLTARGHHLSPEQLARTNIRVLCDKPFSAREIVAKVQEILDAESGRAEKGAA